MLIVASQNSDNWGKYGLFCLFDLISWKISLFLFLSGCRNSSPQDSPSLENAFQWSIAFLITNYKKCSEGWMTSYVELPHIWGTLSENQQGLFYGGSWSVRCKGENWSVGRACREPITVTCLPLQCLRQKESWRLLMASPFSSWATGSLQVHVTRKMGLLLHPILNTHVQATECP